MASCLLYFRVMTTAPPVVSPPADRFDALRFSPESAAALRELLSSGRYTAALSLPMPGRANLLNEFIFWTGFLRGAVNAWDESRHHESYRIRLTRSKGKAPATLYDLFWLHKGVPEEAVRSIVAPKILDSLLDSTLLVSGDGLIHATARCFSFESRHFLFDFDRSQPDFVFFGTDSFIMPRFINGLFPNRRFGRVLDLCTGSGVQGLFLSSRADQTVCADINPRAVSFVRANALLNDVPNLAAVQSNLFSNLEGTFDCITANTPYRPMPGDSGVSDLPLRGGDLGIEFTLELIRVLLDRLRDHGVAILYTSDPVVRNQAVLLDEVKRVIGNRALNVAEYLLFRSYTDEPYLLEHFRRHKIQGYDDCLLVLRKDEGPAFLRRVWHPSFYWRTYLRSEVQRRRFA